MKTGSVRAAAVAAVLCLAVVGTTAAEAAPHGKDEKGPGPKPPASAAQPARRDDKPRQNDQPSQPNKSRDETKAQSQPTKAEQPKPQPQAAIEQPKPDAGAPKAAVWQPAPSPKPAAAKSEPTSNGQDVANRRQDPKQHEAPAKREARPATADGASAQLDRAGEPTKQVPPVTEQNTRGKSGSNPDGGGVDKPFPAAGQPARSQGGPKDYYDGNNGCGQDKHSGEPREADFGQKHQGWDDNQGWCGKPHEKADKSDDRQQPTHEGVEKTHEEKHEAVEKGYQEKRDGGCDVYVDERKHSRDDWHVVKYNHKPEQKGDETPHSQPPPAAPAPVVASPAPAAPAVPPAPTAVPTPPPAPPTPPIQPSAPAQPTAAVAAQAPDHSGPTSSSSIARADDERRPIQLVALQPEELHQGHAAVIGSAVQIEAAPVAPRVENFTAAPAPGYRNVDVGVLPATGGAPVGALAAALAALGGLGLALHRFGRKS